LCKGVDEAGGSSVTARVVKGPYVKPVYEMWPISSGRLPELELLMTAGEDGRGEQSLLPVYQAADLRVVDAAQDWRGKPSSVRLPDSGQLRRFRGCEATTMHMPERKMMNTSLEEIAAHCKVHAAGLHHGSDRAGPRHNIVSLAGVVVTEAASDAYPGDRSRDALPADDDGTVGPVTQQKYVVGVLLTPDERAKPLAEYLKAHVAAEVSQETKQNWQRQIQEALEHLHSLRMTFGASVRGEQTFYYLNQWVVLIGSSSVGEGEGRQGELHAWLNLSSNCTVHRFEDFDAFETGKEADLLGLQKTFDF
jgi:hypothetical protein